MIFQTRLLQSSQCTWVPLISPRLGGELHLPAGYLYELMQLFFNLTSRHPIDSQQRILKLSQPHVRLGLIQSPLHSTAIVSSPKPVGGKNQKDGGRSEDKYPTSYTVQHDWRYQWAVGHLRKCEKIAESFNLWFWLRFVG